MKKTMKPYEYKAYVARRRERRLRKRRLSGKSKKKLTGLFMIVVVIMFCLALKIAKINATDGQRYSEIVMTQAQQSYQTKTIPFQRGNITDRNGTLLATSNKVYNLMLDITDVNTLVEVGTGEGGTGASQKPVYRAPTIQALHDVFGLEESEVAAIIDNPENAENRYYTLKKGFSVTEKKALDAYCPSDEKGREKLRAEFRKELSGTYAGEKLEQMVEEKVAERGKVRGIWLEEDYARSYPMGALACDTIGFTYDNKSADWGIEGYYNDVLNGTNGRQYGYLNADADVEQTIVPATAGKNVVSTIDINVQQIIRNALQNYEDEMAENKGGNDGAKAIGVVVMDPNNGEILGMDSDRWYDLNNPRDLTPFCTKEELAKMSDEDMGDKLSEIWGNYCINKPFEPGSVFKPITSAAGLSTAAISADTKLYCDGGRQVEDRYIACEGSHGQISVGEAIKYSCNSAMMEIALKLGDTDFLKYANAFNFGMKTGIDLPGESSGVMFTAETMGPVDLAVCSFGQGLECTMIQETSAICAAINGGYYYRPHVVKEITDERGSVIQSVEPILERRTNTEAVSAEIRKGMGMVMSSEGTGYVAKIPGYSMGGKTGTAEKQPRGNGKYVLSFVCFAPLENPQVCMYVTVDEPNIEAQETTIYAMSIARNIMVDLLPYLNIFPDEEGYDTSNVDSTKVTNGLLLKHEYLTLANGIVPSHDSKTTLKGNKKSFSQKQDASGEQTGEASGADTGQSVPENGVMNTDAITGADAGNDAAVGGLWGQGDSGGN
uniref:peptidoglycan D,D-transpeptidase FtsI family protein n=1 Tax=Eubacterium cellulosolvens TaxID=29322 RepID=UPI001A993C09|nr:penicillin-binding protein 2 [[Eubacterium] cellulosolvens]